LVPLLPEETEVRRLFDGNEPKQLFDLQVHSQREALPLRGPTGGRPAGLGGDAEQGQADRADAFQEELRYEDVTTRFR
jgi:hypothetical protein